MTSRLYITLLLASLCSWTAQASAEPVLLVLDEVSGNSGETVVAELTVFGLEADNPEAAGLDATVSWDPSLASLSAVLLGDELVKWQVASNIQDGQVQISAASATGSAFSPDGTIALRLLFDLGPGLGDGALEISDTRLFDVNSRPIEHQAVDGLLAVGAVAASEASFGQVKSMFQQ